VGFLSTVATEPSAAAAAAAAAVTHNQPPVPRYPNVFFFPISIAHAFFPALSASRTHAVTEVDFAR